MKVDHEQTYKTTYTFSKNELIEILIAAYQKKSGKILTDEQIKRKNCRLFANNKETINVELVIQYTKTEGNDLNHDTDC